MNRAPAFNTELITQALIAFPEIIRPPVRTRYRWEQQEITVNGENISILPDVVYMG